MATKGQDSRVSALERIADPAPTCSRVIFPNEFPFPIEIDENDLARVYAWDELREAWFRHHAEAERAKAWESGQYASVQAVAMKRFLNPEGRQAQFHKDLAAERFTEFDYTTELGAARAWASRNGFERPESLLESAQETKDGKEKR
jgi:hypothetical protein